MLQQSENEIIETQQQSGKLARRFALVLLPLVLIPFMIMVVVAYLRMHSTLHQEAVDQMIYAIQGQNSALLEWASIREQQLLNGTQRSRIQQVSLRLLMHPEDQEAVSSMQEELENLLHNQGDPLFVEILLLRKYDDLVVSSTQPSHLGITLSNLIAKNVLEPETLPIYDDPTLTPGDIGFLSISPLQAVGTQPNFYLIGLNSGSEVVQLIDDLQSFWEMRSVYRIEGGKTLLAISPGLIIELPEHATALEALELPEHEVFQVYASAEPGTLEYKNAVGQPVISAYQWIPGWNMALLVELATAEIFSGLSDLAPFTVILIVVASIFTLGLTFMVTNRMLRPLTSLADFANRISHGEWLYRVPEGRADELGELAASLNRMAEELGALYQSLESRVEDRTRQIRTASEVARAIISIPNLDELLRQAVQLIKDQFGYDHVSIFLLDSSGQYAVLRESAGEIGQTSRTPGYKVERSPQTLVGWVIENNRSRIITDTGDEPESFKSGLLRGAQTQVSIPLQIAGKPLGVIDVQNMKQDSFQQEDLEVLQTLADQLSSAIENARLAQESANAAERARLISEITTQLSGILEPHQVLQTAAHALHRALGDAEIVVKFVPPEEIPPQV